jgi:hypothetical protein
MAGCGVSAVAQKPDPRPGSYFVTAVDGSRVAWLLGPFDRHEDALSRVDDVRSACESLTAGESHWWAFGTARIDGDTARRGRLNDRFGMEVAL